MRITADDGDYMTRIRELEIRTGDVMLPSVAVESRPGDAIAFAMPLLHAAFGGRRGRRFGAMIYWYPPSTKEQADARRREAAIIRSNHARMFNYPEDAPYCHPHWIAEAGREPDPVALGRMSARSRMDQVTESNIGADIVPDVCCDKARDRLCRTR